MQQLIYMSIPSRTFTLDNIEELLLQNKQRKKEQGITGILLYKKSNFLQMLEGEESAVKALYAKIALDLRHNHGKSDSKGFQV